MANIVQRLISSRPLRGFDQFLSSLGIPSVPEEDDNGYKKRKNKEDLHTFYYTIDEIVNNLPFIHQAADLKTRLITSQGFIFEPKNEELKNDPSETVQNKIEEDRRKLMELFDKKNGLSESLSEMLTTSILETELYGHSGIQAYDWGDPEQINFQRVSWNQFMIVVNELKRNMRGRREILYYLVDLRGYGNEEGITLSMTTDKDTVTSRNKDDKYRYKAIPFEFVHFKLNSETPYGVSPLYYDRLMTQLIIDILRDNITEVSGDGWKGIVMKSKGGMNAYDLGLRSENLPENWREQTIKKFVDSIRKSIKGKQNKDTVLMIDGSIVDEWQKIDRGFRSLEYLRHVEEKASVLAASMLGLLAAFLGDKNSTYASNIGKAMEFAVNYSINPSQIKYMDLITSQILDRYFNGTDLLNYEYKFLLNPLDLSDPKIEADTYKVMSDFVKTLRENGLASINEGIEFINKKVRDLDLTKLDDPLNDAGDIKTTKDPLLPINFEEVEPVPEEDKPEDNEPEEEE